MRTAKLTRYRLRWRKVSDVCWALYFGGAQVARVVRGVESYYAELQPSQNGFETAYDGPSLPQAKREASKAIRLFMCREVDEATVLGKRVKRGRVRR